MFRAFAFLLVLTGAVAADPALAAPARAPEAFLGAASRDARTGRLLLPYAGCFPAPVIRRFAGTGTVAVDFRARAGFRSGPVHTVRDAANLRRWQLVRRDATHVRLWLVLRRAATVTVADDALDQQVVISTGSRPGRGTPARPVVRSAAGLPPTLTPTPTPMPGAARVPAARPGAVTSAVVALPASSATPPRPWFTVGTRYFYANYREVYAAGDTDLQTNAIQVPGLEFGLRGILGDPATALGLSVDPVAYSFRDKNLPLSTHARQEVHAELVGTRRFGTEALHLDAGLGYLLRWESAQHTSAPPQPSYAFATSRVFHGPELVGELEWTWQDDWPAYMRGWQVRARGAIAPYAWSQVDAGLPALPALTSGRFELGLEHPIGAARLGIAYRRWWTGSFGGYDEVFDGPVLTLRSF